MKDKLVLLSAYLLVVLFLYTGTYKLIDIAWFEHDLMSQPIPRSLLPVFKWGLPLLEIIIAAFLVFDSTRTLGFWLSASLMLAFTIYTGLVLFHVFGRRPCSCGGVIRNLTWPQHFIFSIAFTGIAVLGTIYNQNKGPSFRG